MHVYSLTHLTGRRRNENRQTIVLTVEVRRHTFGVLVMSAVASLPITAALFAVLAPFKLAPLAFLAPVLVAFAGLWLFDQRQRSGLKVQNYQGIIDRRRSRNGVLYAAGNPIPDPTLVMHQQVVIPSVFIAQDVARGASDASRRSRRRRARSAREPLT